MAVTPSPIASAVRTPRRAISSEPGTAAKANSIDGNPVRIPIWVALRRSSSWISGMTGGTAKMVSRKPTPASHKSVSEVKRLACDGAPLGTEFDTGVMAGGCYIVDKLPAYSGGRIT
jgi:hypothetical protein